MATPEQTTPYDERYKHLRQWETPEQVEILVAGQAGEQALDAAPTQLDISIRLLELTIRNEATADTVVSLLSLENAVYTVRLSLKVFDGESSEWESVEGRKFAVGQQPIVRASPVTGGTIYISGSGIEASEAMGAIEV